jgi:hypothetical protein
LAESRTVKRRRLSTTARGYGRTHRAVRTYWLPFVRAGLVDCARCGLKIEPGQEFDLGHVDGDRSRYSGPEHRHSRDCPEGGNRATARHRATGRLPDVRSEDW